LAGGGVHGVEAALKISRKNNVLGELNKILSAKQYRLQPTEKNTNL
jgi:hypothetical protein